MNRRRESLSSVEDPLTYLPRKSVQEFAKRRVIYDAQQPSDHLYVVILGRVKLINVGDNGEPLVARIISAEGLFGEACMIGGRRGEETALALETTTLMSWSSAEIEAQIEREPRLGLALSQYLVRQCIELQDRIESIAIYKTPERVMLSLLQLGATLGTRMADGTMRIPGMTHQTLAEYVGTSREIVTFQLNRLRRAGMIRYSRKYLDLETAAMRASLHERGVDLPPTRLAMMGASV